MKPSLDPAAYQKPVKVQIASTTYGYKSTSVSYGQSLPYNSQYAPNIVTNPNAYGFMSHTVPNSNPYPYGTYDSPHMISPKGRVSQDFSLPSQTLQTLPSNIPDSKGSPAQSHLSSAQKYKKFSHLSELEIDDYEKLSTGSTYISPTNRFSFSAPNNESLLHTPVSLNPNPNIPHCPSVKSSPFNKAKDKINFFDPQMISSVTSNRETRDESSIQPSYFKINDSYNRVPTTQGSSTSLLQGLMVPKTPTKTFKISDNFPRRSLSDRTKDVVTNPRILSRLVHFLDLQDVLRVRKLIYEFRHRSDLKRIFKKKLEALISQIRTIEEQYKFWNHVVEFRRIRSEKPLAFTQNFVRKCEHIRDITKDLDRTFPEYEKFTTEKGKDGLLKVLVAISNTMKEVGYIQGLNSVAGVFLYYLKEEESFWMMLYLMERLKTKEIFKSDFEKVSLLNYQLESFVSYYLPSLAQYFQDQPEYLLNITTQWFITLYSYSLSIPNIVKVWNHMFVKGIPFLIQFGLAILSRYKNKILNTNIEELGSFIRDELRQLNDNEESIFMLALDFRVTKKLLKELEAYYRNGKPKVFLTFDISKKGTWSEIPPQTLKTESSVGMSSYRLEAGRARTDSVVSSKSRKSPTGKAPFIQNFVNTIKIDFSDTLKNIFTRKEPNSATIPTEASVSLATQSSFVENEKFQEKSINIQTPPSKFDLIDKDKEMSRNSLNSIYSTELPSNQRSSSFYMPEQSTLRDRLEPPSIQTSTSYKPSISEPKSSIIPQKPSPNPRTKGSNLDLFTRDFPMPNVEVRPPLYGRPKIRPNNNSIDASDLSTFSADKDFIRSLHSNMSTKYLNGSPTPQIHSSTRLSSFADDFKKPIYPKGKTVIEHPITIPNSRPPTQTPTVNIYSINLMEDYRGGSLRKNYEEVMGKRIASSPKKTNINSQTSSQSQTSFKQPEVINLQLSRKTYHHYSVIGDYKKLP